MPDKPIKLRITGDISDPRSIEITEADTGAKITNILEVDIHISPLEGSTVTLKLWGADIDVTGNLRPQVVDGKLLTSLRRVQDSKKPS